MDALNVDVPVQQPDAEGNYSWMSIRAGQDSSFSGNVEVKGDLTVNTVNGEAYPPGGGGPGQDVVFNNVQVDGTLTLPDGPLLPRADRDYLRIEIDYNQYQDYSWVSPAIDVNTNRPEYGFLNMFFGGSYDVAKKGFPAPGASVNLWVAPEIATSVVEPSDTVCKVRLFDEVGDVTGSINLADTSRNVSIYVDPLTAPLEPYVVTDQNQVGYPFRWAIGGKDTSDANRAGVYNFKYKLELTNTELINRPSAGMTIDRTRRVDYALEVEFAGSQSYIGQKFVVKSRRSLTGLVPPDFPSPVNYQTVDVFEFTYQIQVNDLGALSPGTYYQVPTPKIRALGTNLPGGNLAEPPDDPSAGAPENRPDLAGASLYLKSLTAECFYTPGTR
jgi:hypothetical protein